MEILGWLHYTLKTDRGFRSMLKSLSCVKLQQPIIQTAKYEPHAISLLEHLPWVRHRSLIHSQLATKRQQFSILNLSGVWAGKIPGNIHVDTFLEYGKALKPTTEYTFENRIGCKTEIDFKNNTEYLTVNLNHISGTKNGIPVVRYRKWDDSYYLINVDGGNHFAAVYRQCVEQNRDFKFPCRIEYLTLNVEECSRVLERHGFLILATSYVRLIAQLLAEFGLRLQPYWHEFQPNKSLLGIGLDKEIHPNGKRLYHSLIDTLPSDSYFNLSQYLTQIIG